MRQLVYAMVITNNHASLHLRWRENLLEYQYVSKYYEHGCLENFLWSFMSLLTVLFVKNSHILAGIYFIGLKKFLDETWKVCSTLHYCYSDTQKSEQNFIPFEAIATRREQCWCKQPTSNSFETLKTVYTYSNCMMNQLLYCWKGF